jgi:hypothetical protein
VSNFLPPPVVENKHPVIFQTVNAYSSQYFRVDKMKDTKPFISDLAYFNTNCKTCVTGTDKIPYEQFDAIWVVGRYDWDPSSILPKEYFRLQIITNNFTWSDRLQFTYLTPVQPWHFRTYEYRRMVQS